MCHWVWVLGFPMLRYYTVMTWMEVIVTVGLSKSHNRQDLSFWVCVWSLCLKSELVSELVSEFQIPNDKGRCRARSTLLLALWTFGAFLFWRILEWGTPFVVYTSAKRSRHTSTYQARIYRMSNRVLMSGLTQTLTKWYDAKIQPIQKLTGRCPYLTKMKTSTGQFLD